MAEETNGATSDDWLRTQRRNRRVAVAAGEIDDFLTPGWLRVTPQKVMSWDFRKIAR